MEEQWTSYVIMGIYMAFILGVGYALKGKNKNVESYLLGGRSMPFIAVGMSMMMAMFSSISIVQIPSEIFSRGWTMFSLAIFITIPIAIPYYLLFVRFYFKLGSFTPYEYLEYRYDRAVRGIVAISNFYTQTMYIGMVLYTSSKIFEGAYNWPCWLTILLIGGIGLIYTVTGGIKAVVWTDVIQFFFMFGGLFLIVYVLCKNIDGGAVRAVTYAFETGHGAPQFADPDFYKFTPYSRLLFIILLWQAVIWPIGGACSNQATIQQILSTKDWKSGFKSQILSSVFGILASVVLYFIGFAVYTYYSQNPDPVVAAQGGDIALTRFVSTKLALLPSALFMAAMLSAIMSTLNSGINSMATIWLKEIHGKFINRNMSPEKELSVSRWATFLIGLFAISLGLAVDLSGQWLKQSVTEVGTLFYMLGAATLPAFLFAVLSSRANAILVWGYTAFTTGEMLGKNVWYVLSRTAVQVWEKDPSAGFGWGGKLSFIYALIPVAVGVILCIPWCRKSTRGKLFSKIAALAGLVVLGFGFLMVTWWAFSNWCVDTRPLECSFAFYMPFSTIGAFVILWFCPVQPREKWQGLTLGTLGEKILKNNAK